MGKTDDYCNGFAQTVGQIVVFKNGVIDIQALGYDGERTVFHFAKFILLNQLDQPILQN